MLNVRSFFSFPIYILLLSVIPFVSVYAMDISTSGSAEVDLSTPESTSMGYCLGAGEKITEYFYDPIDPKHFGYPSWSDCKIVESKKTDRVGEKYGHKLFIQEGDVEVTFETKIVGKKSGEIKARYWQLLRNFDGKWKIISWYRVPDKYFDPKT